MACLHDTGVTSLFAMEAAERCHQGSRAARGARFQAPATPEVRSEHWTYSGAGTSPAGISLLPAGENSRGWDAVSPVLALRATRSTMLDRSHHCRMPEKSGR